MALIQAAARTNANAQLILNYEAMSVANFCRMPAREIVHITTDSHAQNYPRFNPRTPRKRLKTVQETAGHSLWCWRTAPSFEGLHYLRIKVSTSIVAYCVSK